METLLKNKIMYGNYFWILEAFKQVNKDFNFDIPLKKLNSSTDEIKIYDCIVYHEDKEDSLYLQHDDNIYEYFSNDKYELLLKLIKIYKNRFTLENITISNTVNSVTISGIKTILPSIEHKVKNLVTIEKNFTQIKSTINEKIQKNSSNLNSVIYANVLLVYNDNSSKWVYKYEVKKILFYLKFLPNSKNIKIIRLFPLNIKKLKMKSQTYVNKEDEFMTEVKEDFKKKNLNLKTREEKLFDNIVNKVKEIFLIKYSLILKCLNIETFELDNIIYLYDIKEMMFEKHDNTEVLKTERKLLNFREKYQYRNLKINKDAPNIKEVKQFFFAALDMYGKVQKHHDLDKYLNVPAKDRLSDNIFKDLRPKCPYKYSELIDDDLSKKKFTQYASINHWNI